MRTRTIARNIVDAGDNGCGHEGCTERDNPHRPSLSKVRLIAFAIVLILVAVRATSQESGLSELSDSTIKLYDSVKTRLQQDGLDVEYRSPRTGLDDRARILLLDDFTSWSSNTVSNGMNLEIFACIFRLPADGRYRYKIVKGTRDTAGFHMEVYLAKDSQTIFRKTPDESDFREVLSHFINGRLMGQKAVSGGKTVNRDEVAASFVKQYVESGWFER